MRLCERGSGFRLGFRIQISTSYRTIVVMVRIINTLRMMVNNQVKTHTNTSGVRRPTHHP